MVTSFEWTNPHAYIEVDVADAKGGQKHWTIELGSPSILMRGGWKFNTLKKGDKVDRGRQPAAQRRARSPAQPDHAAPTAAC